MPNPNPQSKASREYDEFRSKLEASNKGVQTRARMLLEMVLMFSTAEKGKLPRDRFIDWAIAFIDRQYIAAVLDTTITIEEMVHNPKARADIEAAKETGMERYEIVVAVVGSQAEETGAKKEERLRTIRTGIMQDFMPDIVADADALAKERGQWGPASSYPRQSVEHNQQQRVNDPHGPILKM